MNAKPETTGASSAPGDPPSLELARQFAGSFGSGLRFGFNGTKKKPVPSAAEGQGALSLKSTDVISSPEACTRVIFSPPLERWPRYVPAPRTLGYFCA